MTDSPTYVERVLPVATLLRVLPRAQITRDHYDNILVSYKIIRREEPVDADEVYCLISVGTNVYILPERVLLEGAYDYHLANEDAKHAERLRGHLKGETGDMRERVENHIIRPLIHELGEIDVLNVDTSKVEIEWEGDT
jgi:hypothetical protein